MSHLVNCFVCAVVAAALFAALTPGVLLTIPPCPKGSVFMALEKEKKKNDECVTSYKAAFAHAAIFGVVIFFICFFLFKPAAESMGAGPVF